VVASSGNAGHNPYLTGSPGTGDGVISVSAVDSAEGFPGATITVGGTPVEAINANGASLDGIGDLTVVRLTGDNALGCSPAAFTAAGSSRAGTRSRSSTAGRAPVSPRPSTASRPERRPWSW
jgi:hypothetical protein